MMTPRFIFLAIGLSSILFFARTAEAAEPKSSKARAERILREVDDLWRGESSHGIISMKVKTAHYARNIRMEGWSKGKDKSLVAILTPLREKGTATLKSGTSVYSYLPKTDRTIRLTPGMMMGSWMGSHFTNDDLVKESRLSEDYEVDIAFEGARGGNNIIEFILLPKPDAAVVWGKIIYTVLENHIPLEAVYYDEDMKVTRSMTFTVVKKMGGRLFPTVMRITPTDKPDEFTELVYEKMDFDIGLADSFFSITQLKRK